MIKAQYSTEFCDEVISEKSNYLLTPCAIISTWSELHHYVLPLLIQSLEFKTIALVTMNKRTAVEISLNSRSINLADNPITLVRSLSQCYRTLLLNRLQSDLRFF